MQKYKILRPPLIKSFELPTQKELLQLKVGDSVKLRFQVSNDDPERMWVTLTDCHDPDVWTGTIDNDAVQQETALVLPSETEISFHPLDIIQISKN